MRELTFGEIAELKKKIETEHPDAELVEIIAAAYEEGYKAAQKER